MPAIGAWMTGRSTPRILCKGVMFFVVRVACDLALFLQLVLRHQRDAAANVEQIKFTAFSQKLHGIWDQHGFHVKATISHFAAYPI